MNITKRTVQITEGFETHEWDITDRKGRRLGSTVCFQTHVYERSEPTGHFFNRIAPGTYFVWRGQATRGGEPFGAIQPFRFCNFCKTEAERVSAVAAYLREAEARAQKWQGR